jgi:hypothetical protein
VQAQNSHSFPSTNLFSRQLTCGIEHSGPSLLKYSVCEASAAHTSRSHTRVHQPPTTNTLTTPHRHTHHHPLCLNTFALVHGWHSPRTHLLLSSRLWCLQGVVGYQQGFSCSLCCEQLVRVDGLIDRQRGAKHQASNRGSFQVKQLNHRSLKVRKHGVGSTCDERAAAHAVVCRPRVRHDNEALGSSVGALRLRIGV